MNWSWGNLNEWAIKIAPLSGGEKLSSDPDELRTWCAISIWAGGHNLTAHKDADGKFQEAINWPAIHLARWFVQAWPAFCGLSKPPVQLDNGLNPKEICDALDREAINRLTHSAPIFNAQSWEVVREIGMRVLEFEESEDSFLEARDTFISRHSLITASGGGLLPNVYFSSPMPDPCHDDVIQIYWDNTKYRGAAFQSAFGDVVVSASFFRKVIEDFVHHIEGLIQKRDSEPIQFGQVHNLRTWPKFFEDVLQGRKTFEIRKNDRNFQVGDILILKESTMDGGYSGRWLPVKVTYIADWQRDLKELGCLAEGYVCMSIEKIPADGFEVNTAGTVLGK